MPDSSTQLFYAICGVLLIGLSKAGFGGGLGMLTTPLCVMAFGPTMGIGILLPLLCAGDAFSLWHYWKKWEMKNLRLMIVGIVVGVAIGAQLFRRFSPAELNFIIGLMAVLFVLFQIGKRLLSATLTPFVPRQPYGWMAGVGAGLTSTFAHGAGPVVTAFLLPQRLPKEIFTGTNVLIFTCINWIKVPFFLYAGMIQPPSLRVSAVFFPLVPLGVWLGVWLNRHIPDKWFPPIVYALTFITGIELIRTAWPALR